MPFHAGAEPPQDQPTATPEPQSNAPAPVDTQSLETIVGNVIGNLMDSQPTTVPSLVDNSAAEFIVTTISPSTTANTIMSTTETHLPPTVSSMSSNAELQSAQTASATPLQSQPPATKPALSPGIIVSIVIMSLLVAALVAGIVVFFLRRKRSVMRQKEQTEYDAKDEKTSRPESFAKSFYSNSSFATGNMSQQHLDAEQRTIGGDSHTYGETYSIGGGSEFDTAGSRKDFGEHHDRQSVYSQYSDLQSHSQATEHAYDWSMHDGRSNASLSDSSHTWQDQMVYGGSLPMSDRGFGELPMPSRFSDSTLSTQPSQIDRSNSAEPWQNNAYLEPRAAPPVPSRTPSPFTPAMSTFSPSAVSSRFPSPGPSRVGTPQLPPSAVQSTGLAAHDFRNTLWPALSPAVPRGTLDPAASNAQSRSRFLPITPSAAAAEDDNDRQTMWFSSHDSTQQHQPVRPAPAYLPSSAMGVESRRMSLHARDQRAQSSRWSLSMAATAGPSRSGSAPPNGPYGSDAPGAGYSTAARTIMAHRKTRHLSIPSHAVELPASLPSPRGSPNDDDGDDPATRWSIDSLLALIDPGSKTKGSKGDAPMARSRSADGERGRQHAPEMAVPDTPTTLRYSRSLGAPVDRRGLF